MNSWLLALRPKTLIAGAIPVLVGSYAAPVEKVNLWIVGSALLVGVLLTIAVNLINDALDFRKGADTKERIGPIRVTASGLLSTKQVLGAAVFVLTLAFLLSFPLILKGGIPILLFILTAICFTYLYTGGPYPLSYHGLGELFVIVFYGFGACLSTYYLQKGTLDLDAFVISLQIGLLATVLIAINNLRDIEEDAKTGKRTLAVRFGVAFAKWELICLIALPFLLNLYWYFTGRFFVFFMPLLAGLIAYRLGRGIWKTAPSPIYNSYLGKASLLLASFGLLLILGLYA